jgi:superfamily II DNA or RNA helicase
MKKRIQEDIRSMMDAGKSVLCLVDQVEHGRELSNSLGIPFATGEDKQSQEYVAQLNSGSIRGLIGTDSKVGEGTDTRNVDILILANFVASKGPVTQCVGRGLRKQGSKVRCIILDYIPTGSTMLSRHAYGRVEIYQEITSKVKVLDEN